MKLRISFCLALILPLAPGGADAAEALDGPYSFSTLAGLAGLRGFTNGNGTVARFSDPIAVVIDRAGTIYLADGGGQNLRSITPAGTVTALAGSPSVIGSADGTVFEARFNGPIGLAADDTGNLYVADSSNHTIRKITPAGVVSTLAGLAGAAGSSDGTGSAARFNFPAGLAADSSGTVYVADRNNQTIRKITPAGAVSTLAGFAGVIGATNGTGSSARFANPTGLAVDANGNLYVADTSSCTIRKISPEGLVTTLAGAAGVAGSADGAGSSARFNLPAGITVDASGTLFVTDNGNSTIRKITAAGAVTTVGGQAGVTGSADGLGAAARFNRPVGIAVDRSGTLIIADEQNFILRRGVIVTPPAIVTAPLAQTGLVGGNLTLAVEATGGDLSYQWRLNGADVPGATSSALTLTNATAAQAGSYTVTVSNALGSAVTAGASVVIVNPPVPRPETYSFTKLAGAGTAGSTDGPASDARFDTPYGIAVDGTGNVFVADYFGHSIRKITAAGIVSTFAGLSRTSGSADGAGATARFNRPCQLAFDNGGNLFVADYGNGTIRRITPAGNVSTVAGLAGTKGVTDGDLATARLIGPTGVAVDASGNVFIADWDASTIRKVSPSGVVSTFAGLALSPGGTDGIGGAARLNHPESLALDSAGNLYVADALNYVIRKITPTGLVSTLAGVVLSPGSTDGIGGSARFSRMVGLATDRAGNLYVGDTANITLRKVTPAGIVSTIGGLPGGWGVADGPGPDARFNGPQGVAVDGNGTIYVAEYLSRWIRKGVLAPVPIALPQTLAVAPGFSATFTAGPAEAAASYQWRKSGVAIPGATGASFTIASTAVADAGSYSVAITNSSGTVVSAAASLSVTLDAARLVNLSTRTRAGSDAQVLTVGFVIAGTTGKQLLVRGIGPTLADYGVPGVLADPRIEFFDGTASVAANDQWGGTAALTNAFSAAGAFGLPAGSNDAALTGNFPAKAYTVQVKGPAGTEGIVLAELYDLDPSARAHFANVSARCQVGLDDDQLIAGFVIAGTGTRTLLIRATGPALTQYGVSGVLSDPVLLVRRQGETNIIAGSNDWGASPAMSTAVTSTGAFPLTVGSKDAATLVTLPPGAYTVEVGGNNRTTGVALVEVYEVP